VQPDFAFWLNQYSHATQADGATFNPHVVLYFADQARAAANTDLQWARAEAAYGEACQHVDNLQEALQSFSGIADRFGAASELEFRELVARALINKGVTLNKLGRPEEAIATYDDVLSRFGAASEPELCGLVEQARLNKGQLRQWDALTWIIRGVALGRCVEAIAAYDEVLSRFGSTSEPELREEVAEALCNMAFTLRALKRRKQANAVLDDLLTRFGGVTEPEIIKTVERARKLRK